MFIHNNVYYYIFLGFQKPTLYYIFIFFSSNLLASFLKEICLQALAVGMHIVGYETSPL